MIISKAVFYEYEQLLWAISTSHDDLCSVYIEVVYMRQEPINNREKEAISVSTCEPLFCKYERKLISINIAMQGCVVKLISRNCGFAAGPPLWKRNVVYYSTSLRYYMFTSFTTLYIISDLSEFTQVATYMYFGRSNYRIGPHRTASGDIGPHRRFIVFRIGLNLNYIGHFQYHIGHPKWAEQVLKSFWLLVGFLKTRLLRFML